MTLASQTETARTAFLALDSGSNRWLAVALRHPGMADRNSGMVKAGSR